MAILKEESIFQYFDEMMPNIQDIDLTWSNLSNSQAIQLSDTLTRSTFLKSVNLSFLSVSNKNHESHDCDEECSFVKLLVQFISESVMLMHINLNGIGFNEAEITDLVENGIAKS